MEQTASQIKQKIQVSIKQITSFICQLFALANSYAHQLIGQENYSKMQQFFQKHAFACIFGSMVFTACAFQFRFRKRAGKQLFILSDTSKREKSTSKKLSQKLKGKIKFASSDNQEQDHKRQQILKTQNYDSTLDSKRQFKKIPQKRKQRFQKQQEFQQILQRQIKKSRENIVVLDDSKSDKIFNEMYGMYQEALRKQE